jgi:hypothetical protein
MNNPWKQISAIAYVVMLIALAMLTVLFFDWREINADCITSDCRFSLMFLQENIDDIVATLVVFFASLMLIFICKNLSSDEDLFKKPSSKKNKT